MDDKRSSRKAFQFLGTKRIGLCLLLVLQSCNETTSPPPGPRTSSGLQSSEGVTVRLFGPREEVKGITWPATDSQTAFEGPCKTTILLGETKKYTLHVVGGILTEEFSKGVESIRLYLTRHPVSLGDALTIANSTAMAFEKQEDKAFVAFEATLRREMPHAEAGLVRIANVPLPDGALLSIELSTKVDESGWFVQVYIGPNTNFRR